MYKAFRHRNLPLLLLQARAAVLAQFRPVLTAHGLTEQQWRVLRLLDERGELEPSAIARATQILKPSLTGVLGRLSDLGLIERSRLDADGRRQRVSLTPKCRRLIQRIAPRIEARYAAIERNAGRALVTRLYRALDRLLAASARPATGRPAGGGRPSRKA